MNCNCAVASYLPLPLPLLPLCRPKGKECARTSDRLCQDYIVFAGINTRPQQAERARGPQLRQRHRRRRRRRRQQQQQQRRRRRQR